MRKSIFDIISSQLDIGNETKRILKMCKKENTLCVDSYSYYNLFEFVNRYCFKSWNHRNHCVDVNDYLETLGFEDLKISATYDIDSQLTLIELVYNFWNLSQLAFNDNGYDLKWCGNYYHLKDVMDDILQQYNHTVFTNEDKDCVLVVENKEEVTAAVEILPTKLAFDIIKYNHRSLQGELELKKGILLSLGAELEPKRKELQALNNQLSEDIFFMLNNINIRHNNRSERDKAKYKEYVSKMTKNQLERWYDELYQMILLAFLLLDNVDRTIKVKELKDKITGVNNNG